jgi:hypothetical protein
MRRGGEPWVLCYLVVALSTLDLSSAAAAGGNASEDGGGSHGLFEMGGHMKYDAVAATMGFIIVFTIFCEQCVAHVRDWVEDFNPLLQPCVDKVIAELMILGACAFAIMLVDENTHYALSSGTLMPVEYYYTLHWVQTLCFIFALVYVTVACFLLWLCDHITNVLAKVDAKPPRELVAQLARGTQGKLARRFVNSVRRASDALMVNVEQLLHSHLSRTSLSSPSSSSGRGQSDNPEFALPAAVVDRILGEIGNDTHGDHEENVRRFLCSTSASQVGSRSHGWFPFPCYY